MATTTTQTQQPFSSEHALFILRALQTVKSPVVFEIDEIAAERGVKVNSIQKQFSRIKERYGLNIGTKSSGCVGRHDALVKASKRVTAPKAAKMEATAWHEVISDEDAGVDAIGTPVTPRKSDRAAKPTSKKREYASSDLDEDSGEDATWHAPPWSKEASAKRQKRFWDAEAAVPERDVKAEIKNE